MKTLTFFLLFLPVPLLAQDEEPSGSDALNLTIGNTGISFGNAPRVNGLRFNWSDSGIDEINGINFTLWRPSEKNPRGDINGLALGIVAPAAGRIRGIALTPGAVLTGTSMEGINIGGLALVSQGSIGGINIGGLAAVGQGNVAGITITALAIVAQGSIAGLSVGGLAAVSQGSMTGVSIGGLATVSQGDFSGLSFGGLATVAQGSVYGFSFGGLAVVGQGDMSGIFLGGVAVVGQRSISGITTTIGLIESDGSITGLNIAGYKIDGRTVTGLNIGAVWTETENIGLFTVGGYNRTYDTQTGLTIGIFNHAHNLAGIQIGLLNHVETNPPGLRWLPILNAKF